MQTRQPPMFDIGDKVIYLGSEESCWGINHRYDKYIGNIVTISDRHPTGYPYAYSFKESRSGYFFSENCFKSAVVVDLPEFEVNKSIDDLF